MEAVVNNVMVSRISISTVLILTTLFCTTTLADWNTKQPPSSGKIYIYSSSTSIFYVKSHDGLSFYSIIESNLFFALKIINYKSKVCM